VCKRASEREREHKFLRMRVCSCVCFCECMGVRACARRPNACAALLLNQVRKKTHKHTHKNTRSPLLLNHLLKFASASTDQHTPSPQLVNVTRKIHLAAPSQVLMTCHPPPRDDILSLSSSLPDLRPGGGRRRPANCRISGGICVHGDQP
jgi:hypothetical protein